MKDRKEAKKDRLQQALLAENAKREGEEPPPPAEEEKPKPELPPILTPKQKKEAARVKKVKSASHPVDLMELASTGVLLDGKELNPEQAKAVKALLKKAMILGADKIGYLRQAHHHFATGLKLLLEANTREGHGTKFASTAAVQEEAGIRKVMTSLEGRTREAAFALAELEQAVDPIEGLKIVAKGKRKVNAKARKKMASRHR